MSGKKKTLYLPTIAQLVAHSEPQPIAKSPLGPSQTMLIHLGKFSSCLFACLLWISPVPSDSAEPNENKVDFNRDIRPILRQNCTGCHGGVKNAGGISFVNPEAAYAEGESGTRAIVPGNVLDSEMVRRISSNDPDERMPPPDHGQALNPDDQNKIRRWIEQGAKWEQLWSLRPVQTVSPPNASGPIHWKQRPTDLFLLQKMTEQGLKPSPEASPSEWLRRVTFDLIGLPPMLSDFDAFLKAWKSNPVKAKEQVVDRLLQSDRFGERWATMWLDLARYSDTYGYEKDPNRTIWPWRDWVIRAFNADMPFDEFTRKQIAGDLLPNATAEDLLATAFHRNTQCNTEGGTDDEEFRYAAVVDRVSTIWTTWHSTTFGCVRCHSHPYDPIAHEEFYRFAAFFDNAEDCDQSDDFPKLKLNRSENGAIDLRSLKELLLQNDDSNSANLQMQLDRLRKERNEIGLAQLSCDSTWNRIVPIQVATTGGTIECSSNGEIKTDGTLPVGVVYTLEAKGLEGATAIRIHLDPVATGELKIPERGQVLSEIQMTAKLGEQTEPVEIQAIVADYLAGPYQPEETLKPGAAGFGSYPVTTGPRWCVLVLKKPIHDQATSIEIKLTQSAASNGGFQASVLRRFHLDSCMEKQLLEIGSSKVWQVIDLAIATTKEKLAQLKTVDVPVLVEREARAKRSTYFLARGDRTKPDTSVQPGVPAVLSGSLPSPRNRLELADWMCSPEHPLTARTLVNRVWAEMFGTGLVDTVEDMGTSGSEPTHPELLDFLARRLAVDYKWSIKKLIRELALTSAYGQTSQVDTKRLEVDRFNRWLARGPRVRLTAEMVRDQGLAISGLLSEKQFGPPVFPPQPEGIWNSVYSGEKWTPSIGEDRYRRAIYTFQKRTAGYPGYLAFDAPSREVCSARRIVTNTPLQALATLNDPAFLEMAQSLAARMLGRKGEPESSIRFGCRLFSLDEPNDSVVKRLLQLYEDALAEYEKDDELTNRLGRTSKESAMVLVASAMLNLDTSLTR